MSRHQIHVATTHTVAHVATSNPCRDLPHYCPCRDNVSAHSGVSRSRRQTPGRDLTYCCPCRDLKNDVVTSTQLSPISATSRCHFFHVTTSFAATHVATSKCCPDININWPKSKAVILRPTATQPGRDATSWSRPHVQPNQVASSNLCRDLNKS